MIILCTAKQEQILHLLFNTFFYVHYFTIALPFVLRAPIPCSSLYPIIIWNEIQTPWTSLSRNLFIKYLRRSEIYDGSSTIPNPNTASDIAKRALHPNCTYMNVAYCTERKLRPHMEDRSLKNELARLSPLSHQRSMESWRTSTWYLPPIHADSIPFGQDPISEYSVFERSCGRLSFPAVFKLVPTWSGNHLDTNLPRALSTFKNIDMN